MFPTGFQPNSKLQMPQEGRGGEISVGQRLQVQCAMCNVRCATCKAYESTHLFLVENANPCMYGMCRTIEVT